MVAIGLNFAGWVEWMAPSGHEVEWHQVYMNNTPFREVRPIRGQGVALALPITHPILQLQDSWGLWALTWKEGFLTPECLSCLWSRPLLRVSTAQYTLLLYLVLYLVEHGPLGLFKKYQLWTLKIVRVVSYGFRHAGFDGVQKKIDFKHF